MLGNSPIPLQGMFYCCGSILWGTIHRDQHHQNQNHDIKEGMVSHLHTCKINLSKCPHCHQRHVPGAPLPQSGHIIQFITLVLDKAIANWAAVQTKHAHLHLNDTVTLKFYGSYQFLFPFRNLVAKLQIRSHQKLVFSLSRSWSCSSFPYLWCTVIHTKSCQTFEASCHHLNECADHAVFRWSPAELHNSMYRKITVDLELLPQGFVDLP